MNILPAVLVAFSLYDVLMPAAPVQVPREGVTYAESGVGELTVIQQQSPVLGSVPRGAQRIPFLTLNLSASCDADIRVDTITLKHAGLGGASDISGMYAMLNYRRISRSARFDARSQEAVLRFRGFTIPKCGAVSLEIVGDLSPDSVVASEHAVEITGSEKITSSAKQTIFTDSDPTEKVVAAPSDAGTLTARFLRVPGRPGYGRIETVARLQLTADSEHSHLLKTITLTNKGSARDMDLQWLVFETLSGKKVSRSTARMRGNTAVIQFDPTYPVDRSQTIVLNLKAEIRGSQTRTIDFHLEEESDLHSLPYRGR